MTHHSHSETDTSLKLKTYLCLRLNILNTAWLVMTMCFPSGIEAGSKHDTVEAWVQEFVDFPGGSEVKNPPANLGDTEDACSIPG